MSDCNRNTVLCRVSELPEHGARELVVAGEPPSHIIVMRRGEQVHAYLNICPHAGRPLNWAPDQFLFTPEGKLVCAAHGASFRVDTGEAVGGPCLGAHLTAFPIQVCGDEVLDARGRV